MKIGVFDSGAGGMSVANAIKVALPEHEVVFVNDAQHMPYGTKRPDEVYSLVEPILQGLVDQRCDVIVIACNTVTTLVIGRLRSQFAGVPLVGVEPMVKPAALQSKVGIIAVCATPATLASKRYAELKQAYAQRCTVLEPDCADWSVLIEDNTMSESKIRDSIVPVLDAGADVIVLACTHYHWIEDDIVRLANGRATVIQPEPAIVGQLKLVLERLQ